MNPDVDRPMQTIQIIVGAMALGLLTFSVVAIALHVSGAMTPDASRLQVLSLVLLALALAELPAYFVIRQTVLAKFRAQCQGQSPDEILPQLMPAYTTITLIGAAMAEGLGLLGALIHILTGSVTGLAAPAVALLVLAAVFPTRERLRRFAENVTDSLG